MLERLGACKIIRQGETLSAAQLLKRPEIGWRDLKELDREGFLEQERLDESDIAYLEANCKYEGYIRIQNQRIGQMDRFLSTEIPDEMNFDEVPGLSIEMRQRLDLRKPRTIAEAQQIPGVTPAALNALRAYLTRREKAGK